MSSSVSPAAFDAIVLADGTAGALSAERAAATMRTAGAREVAVVAVEAPGASIPLPGDVTRALVISASSVVVAPSLVATMAARVARDGSVVVPFLDVGAVGAGLAVGNEGGRWDWASADADVVDAVAPLLVIAPSARARLDAVSGAVTGVRSPDAVIAGIVAGLAAADAVIDLVSPRHLLVDVVAGDDVEHVAGLIESRWAAFDEERARMGNAVKEWDGWFTTHLVSPYTKHIARLLGRTRVTPTAVTLASIAFALVAAALVAAGGRIAWVVAALLVQWSFALDCVDGQLARFALRSSVGGAWLDVAADRVKETALLAAVGIAGGGSAVPTAAAVIAIQAVRHAANTQHPPAVRPPSLRRRWAGVVGCADADRDRDGGGVALWGRRLAVYPIGERLAVISIGLLVGSIWFVLVVALAWNVVALLAQWHGRRRPAGRAAVRRIAAGELVEAPLAARLSVSAPDPRLAVALMSVAGAAVALASRESLALTVVASVAWVAVATWSLRDASSRASVAWLRAVDHAVVIAVLAGVADGSLVLLIGVVVTAHADVPYARGYGGRLGAPPRWPTDVPELRPAVVAVLAAAGVAGGAGAVAAVATAALVARWSQAMIVARRSAAAPSG